MKYIAHVRGIDQSWETGLLRFDELWSWLEGLIGEPVTVTIHNENGQLAMLLEMSVFVKEDPA